MSEYSQIRQSAYDANMQLPALGLVVFTFGNVSVADRQSAVFAIKPSGLPYSELTPEKMVVVDFEGKIVEGDLRPSSDTPTHAVLYQAWENTRAIVHTHSTYATAWSQALRDIPIYGTTHADHLSTDIPCSSPMEDEMIAGMYEAETGNQILRCMQLRNLDYTEVEMMLVGNHGPFTWGTSPEKAVYNSAVLEELAKIAFLTEQLKPGALRLTPALIRKHYDRKHGSDSYYGQK